MTWGAYTVEVVLQPNGCGRAGHRRFFFFNPRNRDNVHDLVAGKDGAQVLDVFTFFSKRAGSRYLQVRVSMIADPETGLAPEVSALGLAFLK